MWLETIEVEMSLGGIFEGYIGLFISGNCLNEDNRQIKRS